MVSRRLVRIGIVFASGLIILLRTFTSSLAYLADEPIIGVVLTLIAASESAGTFIAKLIEWILYTYILYETTPKLYPAKINAITSKPGFRALTTLSTVWLAIALSKLSELLSQSIGLPGMLASLKLTLAVPTILALAYFGFVVYGWVIADSDFELYMFFSDIRAPAFPFANEKFRTEDPDNDAIRTAITTAFLTWSVIWVMLAVLITALGNLYPIGVIAILVGLFIERATDSAAQDDRRDHTPENPFDIESRLLSTIEWLSHPKGTVSYTIIIAGVLTAMSHILEFHELAGDAYLIPPYSEVYQIVPPIGLIRVTYLVAGVYGLYYWIIEAQRLEYFLAEWNKYRANSTGEISSLRLLVMSSQTEGKGEILTRPPGLLVPIPVLFACLRGYVQMEYFPLPIDLYLLLWVIVVGVVGWTVFQAQSASPQEPVSEQVAIPIAILMSLLGWGMVSSYPNAVTATLACVLVLFYFCPELFERFSRT
ncbi:hypothetical protein ACFQE1_00970 [Halobium palmae]|uniref:Uncharacterized protein n=1 Tax=Halobium palmae TaxID=1776492 RepID=A0ABD5RVK8_9EURY